MIKNTHEFGRGNNKLANYEVGKPNLSNGFNYTKRWCGRWLADS